MFFNFNLIFFAFNAFISVYLALFLASTLFISFSCRQWTPYKKVSTTEKKMIYYFYCSNFSRNKGLDWAKHTYTHIRIQTRKEMKKKIRSNKEKNFFYESFGCLQEIRNLRENILRLSKRTMSIFCSVCLCVNAKKNTLFSFYKLPASLWTIFLFPFLPNCIQSSLSFSVIVLCLLL